MGAGRYTFIPKLFNFKSFATSDLSSKIYFACDNNVIATNTHVIKQGERLDTIAGKIYGSGALWWVIAAASGIGWGTQIPPGTLVRIPTDLSLILVLSRQ
tara:strand:- start:3471 stop:3770 length:300 start_codon:yes stop_codon:yes gene_type:complete